MPYLHYLIKVRCFNKENIIDSHQTFEPNLRSLDHLENWVRAHITDPNIMRIELKKELVKDDSTRRLPLDN